jgi:RNA polymerase sigma-70 factor (ECF subfamily)
MTTTACLDRKPTAPHAASAPTDENLMGRFQADGDQDAFAMLVHRYEHELFGYLRRYLHDAALAEDVFQATFLRVHLKRASFETGRSFRPWLYTIATNLAIDARRRGRRHRMATLDARGADDDRLALLDTLASRDDTPAASEAAESEAWVRAAVEDLSTAQRQLVQLIYHQGLKYREVAGLLGIPLGTVKSRMHTVIVSLGEAWRRSEWSHGGLALAPETIRRVHSPR